MIVCEPARCETCGVCIGVCPADAIVMGRHAVAVNDAACIRCGACIEVCPVGALEKFTTDEKQIKR